MVAAAFRSATACCSVDGAGLCNGRPGLGRAPNTRRVGTRPSGPAESLIAFTAIIRASFFSTSGASSQIMLYALRAGTWYISTNVILFADSTGTDFVQICSRSAIA